MILARREFELDRPGLFYPKFRAGLEQRRSLRLLRKKQRSARCRYTVENLLREP